MTHVHWLCALTLTFLLAGCAGAQTVAAEPGPIEPRPLSLSGMFTDHMVVQRNQPIPVWGWATPGREVTATLGDRTASAAAGEDGAWRVDLDALEAGGPMALTVTDGQETLTRDDVLVGEVWLCSGQSNMEWQLQRAAGGAEAVAGSENPQIRLYAVPNRTSDQAEADLVGRWAVCGPDSARDFSAVGYFFGQKLHEELNVPIGLIEADWGGTPAEAWTSAEGLQADPSLRMIYVNWRIAVENFDLDAVRAEYNRALNEWRMARIEAERNGEPAPPRPRPPQANPGEGAHRPTCLYNGMIAPVVPYGLRGVIWYQGEANAGRAAEYARLFPAMIRDWRSQWGQGDFPFLFVQLANYMAAQTGPSEGGWAPVREAQRLTLSLPNTGMAVAIDIGEAGDIHPRNKRDVGLRLARWALHDTYDMTDVVRSGPLYREMEIEDGRIRLHFDHTDGGLAVRAPDGGIQSLAGFAICGADRQWVWAEAQIDGETVVVRADDVPEPVAVRYGWASNPVCNLVNGEGLPAAPFATDNWWQAGN